MTLSDEEREWAERMRRFLDTRDLTAITQADLDRLHEHWSFQLRLRDLDLERLLDE
jgi:hypothetical protein